MTLSDLTELLDQYASGDLALGTLQERLAPLLAADPLDVEQADSAPWDSAHDDARLLWRLVYLFESESADGDRPRRLAGRVVRCLRDTGSAADTFELLPLLLDQDRFATIVARHRAGVISRTGFLSVLAESGYPAHVKLWLEHAPPEALDGLVLRLDGGAYLLVVRAFERPPG